MSDDFSNPFDPEENKEYRIWRSAQIVQTSEYWQYLLEMFDYEMATCTADLQDHVMNGRDKQALNLAARMHAYNWLLETMSSALTDLAPVDQPEEE